MRSLCFYEDDELDDLPEVLCATTYKQYCDKLFTHNVLYTNETSALDFDNFKFYDIIEILTHDNRLLKFYKPVDSSGIITHNTCCQKELRLAHNFRKLFIAGMFDTY